MRGCPKLEVLEQPYIKISVNSRRHMAHSRTFFSILLSSRLLNQRCPNAFAHFIAQMGQTADKSAWFAAY
jgi:hypothetical protein